MSQSQPNRPNLDDYVPVNERIAAFYEKYPEGSLQSEVVVHTETMIAMVARAYRSPDDARPGMGHSSIEVPGRTPYTRGSEMENCETSAWGRALAALGFEVKRGIASAEEVRNKSGSEKPTEAPKTAPAPRSIAPAATDTPELSEDDWQGLFDDKPAAAKPSPVADAPGISSREFFDLVDNAGLDRKDVTKAARKMFGDSRWKVTELTDGERAALWFEIEPVAA